MSHFNPRSREGSDSMDVLKYSQTAFQSTLPRRERHLYERQHLPAVDISIHAPAKGATSLLPATGGV